MSGAMGDAGRNTRALNRFAITKRLVAKLTHDEAVIGGIGNTNFDLWASGRRAQNFYMLGSMGLACPIALGVALAQPHRHVFALEGDGSLLMQLGCLATIAARRPKNLTIIVMDNGVYEITGAQETASAEVADLVAIARAAGIAQSAWAADEGDFEHLVDEALARGGPEPDRRAHRARAGDGHHRARPDGDPRPLHARPRGAPGGAGMISRADILWLGIAAGVSGGLIGGMMLGLGLDLVVEGQPLGWLLLVPGAPASALVGWIMARRLARQL